MRREPMEGRAAHSRVSAQEAARCLLASARGVPMNWWLGALLVFSCPFFFFVAIWALQQDERRRRTDHTELDALKRIYGVQKW